MATATELTFDIVPPRRPSLVDVGNNTMTDHATRPPNPATMPHAAQLNQWAMQIARFGGVVPVAIFSIKFSAGTPSIDSFVCLPTAPITSTFTITDNGNGDTSITWPAGTFPTPVARPMATAHDFPFVIAGDSIANGVQVVTANLAGVHTDCEFTITVF